MRENEKSCDTCAHSYMERENFKLRQKCRSSEYNASDCTHEMFMILMGPPPESSEAIPTRGQGYCRFWTPKTRKG